jgi:hypothetical protein
MFDGFGDDINSFVYTQSTNKEGEWSMSSGRREEVVLCAEYFFRALFTMRQWKTLIGVLNMRWWVLMEDFAVEVGVEWDLTLVVCKGFASEWVFILRINFYAITYTEKAFSIV